MKVSEFPTSFNRVFLSSAFSNRMLTDSEALSWKKNITLQEAKDLVALAEMSSNIEFQNVLNPRHESTCSLAKGLTKSEPTGAMVSLSVGDVVVVIQPHESSRNDKEFNVKHFEMCIFQVLQQLPLSMIER
jgi:hypothetical protein